MRILEIDNGYWHTKSPLIKFRSKVEETKEILNKNNTYQVALENKTYLVGDGAENYNIELDKTNNILHKITTYTMLGLSTERETESFNIVVTYPLNLYNAENKLSFSQFLKTKNHIPIVINGVQKYIHINECIVFPQTLPVVYLNAQYYKNRIIAVIDIGGYTAQGCIIENLNLIQSSRFSEPLGCFILYNNIKKELNKEFNINIRDYEIPHVIKTGIKINPEKSLKIINEILYSHCLEIKKVLRMNNWNIENLNFLFTGGGSLLLENFLIKMFGGYLSADPVMDNVKGLRIVSEMVYK